MFFSKKGLYVLEEYFKKPRLSRSLNFAIRSCQDDENGMFNDKREQLWVTNVSEKFHSLFE